MFAYIYSKSYKWNATGRGKGHLDVNIPIYYGLCRDSAKRDAPEVKNVNLLSSNLAANFATTRLPPAMNVAYGIDFAVHTSTNSDTSATPEEI